jgi:hypothetical protein
MKIFRSLAIGILIIALTACNSSSTNIKDLSEVNSITYDKKVIDFPDSIPNYEILKSKISGSFRLFENDGFVVFPELVDYTGTNSCEPYFLMIRWRSDNPDVELTAGTGIDTEPGKDISWGTEPKIGGAGYIKAYSCVEPLIAFSNPINGNESNLADVNYEIRIWDYKPKI